jgi:hemerythrin-like metal-binding protein
MRFVMRVVASSGDAPEGAGAEGVPETSEPFQLRWSDSFETGNAEIDAIHRKLILDCNILLAMISSGSSWAMITARAKRVMEDCIAHFRLEESILENLRFSRLAEHKVEHARLEEEMRSALTRMESRDGAVVDRFEHARWLGKLLIDAIVRNDLDFRSHIMNEKGL